MWQHVDLTQSRFPGTQQYLLVPNGAIAGYSNIDDQYVVYYGTDNHIHVLIYEGGWQHINLSPSTVKGAIAAYRTTKSHHIVFHGLDDNIHMLIYDHYGFYEGPRHVNLNDEKFNHRIPTVKGAIAAYATGDDQRVLYHGLDDNIHMLKYSSKWEYVNLTGGTFGGHVPAVKGGIATYRVDSRYVVYHGADDHIHLLIGGEENIDLHHDRFNDRIPAVKGAIAAYARGADSQHVVFHGADDKMHMLIYDSYEENWRDVNLNDEKFNNRIPAVKGAIAAYMTADTQHVIYHGTDEHIHELHLRIEVDSGGWLENVVNAVENTVGGAVETVFNWGSKLGDAIPEPIKDGIETAFNWANTIVGGLITTLDGLLSPITSFVGAILGILSAFPVIGRSAKWAYEGGMAGATWVLNLPDEFLTYLGIMPIKKMRLYVLVQRSETGPVAEPRDVEDVINLARDIFFEEARIKILPVKPFHYSDSTSAPDSSLSSYWKVLDTPSDTDTLDVCCGLCAFGKDQLSVGTKFEVMMTSESFWGNGGRAISIGAPVVAFAVRSFSDGKHGCSLGPLTDYVTILLDKDDLDRSILAHELGHACNLPHSSNPSNLMYKGVRRGHTLTRAQKMLVRASRHVTWW